MIMNIYLTIFSGILLVALPIGALLYVISPEPPPARPKTHQAETNAANDQESQQSKAAESDKDSTYKKIRWDLLQELDFQTGDRTEKLNDVLGTFVRIPGFIVPLEVSDRMTSTFLLVPTAGACVHVPPPPPNQMIFIRLKNGGVPAQEKRAPIWVHGKLSLDSADTKWGKVGFAMDGYEIKPFTGGY